MLPRVEGGAPPLGRTDGGGTLGRRSTPRSLTEGGGGWLRVEGTGGGPAGGGIVGRKARRAMA